MIDQAAIAELAKSCPETEAAELSVRHNAYILWLKAYREDSSRASLVELDAAKRSLERMVIEIRGRMDSTATDAAPLAHIAAAVAYLKGDGWKIGKSKLYNDARSGLIRINADNTVNEAEAIAYAHKYLKRIKDSGNVGGDIEALLREKTEAEVALIKRREEKLAFENSLARGRYLLKDDVYLQEAINIGALEAGLKNMHRSYADEWLYRVGADSGKAPLYCDLVYAAIDKLLDDFGNMDEIKVVIRRPSDDKAPAL